MSEAVGFTGTRNLTGAVEATIRQALLELNPDDTVVTGACIGVDAYAAHIAWRQGRPVHTVVPADRSRVDPCWRDHCTSFEEMPPGTTYRDRNERIVALSDRLIAIPEAAEDAPQSRRSGTWMTVRIARKAGKRVDVEMVSRPSAARGGGGGGVMADGCEWPSGCEADGVPKGVPVYHLMKLDSNEIDGVYCRVHALKRASQMERERRRAVRPARPEAAGTEERRDDG